MISANKLTSYQSALPAILVRAPDGGSISGVSIKGNTIAGFEPTDPISIYNAVGTLISGNKITPIAPPGATS